jgi:hypothetical protein
MKRKYIYVIAVIFILLLMIVFVYFKQSTMFDDYVLYIPNFLSHQEYQNILRSLKTDTRPHDVNRNGLLKKTIIDKKINHIFYSPSNIQKIKQLTGKHVFQSKVPIEYRMYQLHNGMDWHSDTLLYEEPQYECVYTIKNTSDSHTEYIDQNNQKHSVWTEPNSLMIVRANGFFHHVTPVTKGVREIFKLIYTPTHKINKENKYEFYKAMTGDT